MDTQKLSIWALKILGLGFSLILTVSLNYDLFWVSLGPWLGAMMIICAVALFEGGATLWNHTLTKARGFQRTIAFWAMWICTGLSILSSAVQIARLTGYSIGFDPVNGTVFSIIVAMAVNFIAVMGYEYFHPDTLARHRDLDREAMKKTQAHIQIGRAMTKAYEIAETEIEAMIPQWARDMVEEAKREVQNGLRVSGSPTQSANRPQPPYQNRENSQNQVSTRPQPPRSMVQDAGPVHAVVPPKPKPQDDEDDDEEGEEIEDMLKRAGIARPTQPPTRNNNGQRGG